MRVERYFYIRAPGTTKGGATIRVVGDTNEDEVAVQVTHCSQNTAFSRKEGRKYAEEKEHHRMPLADLPKKMMRTAHRVIKLCKTIPASQRTDYDLWNTDESGYGFTMKFFRAKPQLIELQHDTPVAAVGHAIEAAQASEYDAGSRLAQTWVR